MHSRLLFGIIWCSSWKQFPSTSISSHLFILWRSRKFGGFLLGIIIIIAAYINTWTWDFNTTHPKPLPGQRFLLGGMSLSCKSDIVMLSLLPFWCMAKPPIATSWPGIWLLCGCWCQFDSDLYNSDADIYSRWKSRRDESKKSQSKLKS